MFMPFQILGMWIRALLAVVLLGAGLGLLGYWYTHRERVVSEPLATEERRPAEPGAEGDTRAGARTQVSQVHTRVVPWRWGFNWDSAALVAGVLLTMWSLGGGWVASPRWRRPRGTSEPMGKGPAERRVLRASDGTEISVGLDGPPEAEPVVFTHGWGLDSQEWCYARRELSQRFRVITWDLPGLGASPRPRQRDWSLERLARCLDAVVAVAADRPATLVGHSIGGMILLTYCRLFPEAIGTRVRALVLAHSTYTNPVRTTEKAGLYQALQKPVLEPLCHLMIWLSPLFRALNWLSYLNGSAHRSTERSSFSGRETADQLDFLTRYYCQAAPDVVAHGMLAMFRYEAADVLPRISVPTLVVTGDQDRTCRPEASHVMAQTIPGADLAVLAPARHCGLFEHHGEFHSVLARFLAAHGGAVPAAHGGTLAKTLP